MLLQTPSLADAPTGHCPNCGGGRKLGEVKCGYCGSVLIDPVDESAVSAALADIERDRQFGLLAIRGQNFTEAEWRFGSILERCPDDVAAWVCKGHAVGMQSDINGDRLQESLVCFEQALTLTDGDETGIVSGVMRGSIDERAGEVGTHSYVVMRLFAQEHAAVESTRWEMRERADAVLSFLWAVHRRTSSFPVTLAAIAEVCASECKPLRYDDRIIVPTKARKAELKEQYDRAVSLLRAIAPDHTPSKFDEPSDADGMNALTAIIGGFVVLGVLWAAAQLA